MNDDIQVSIDDVDNAIKRLNVTSLQSAEDAAKAADEIAERFGAKGRYMAVDRGAAVSPRYAITPRPQIGDKVSRAFNGDYCPEGEIVHMSATMSRIETSTGVVFTRRKPYKAAIRNSAVWMVKGSDSIVMVRGHISRRNMEF